jgi:hypothetical protein
MNPASIEPTYCPHMVYKPDNRCRPSPISKLVRLGRASIRTVQSKNENQKLQSRSLQSLLCIPRKKADQYRIAK